VGGVGGTLAGNALSLAAIRATLADVLTEESFARMIPLGERWAAGVQATIDELGLPWHVSRLGCRAASTCSGPSSRGNGAEAAREVDFELGQYMHLHALNRGILLTPSTTWPSCRPRPRRPTSTATRLPSAQAARSLVEA